jgi:hypothetical protein
MIRIMIVVINIVNIRLGSFIVTVAPQDESMEHDGNLFLTGVNINTDKNVFKQPEEIKSEIDQALVVTKREPNTESLV